MAFEQFKLDIATNQSRGIFNQYVYETEDTTAETQAAGYFEASRFANKTPEIWIGSLIKCNTSDGFYTALIESGGTVSPIADTGLISTLTDGQVPKKDDATGMLVYSGATVDPVTEEWTFDKDINVPTSSINLGDVITLSEGTSSLLDRDNVRDRNSASVRSIFDDTGSEDPSYFKLDAEFNNVIQPILTEVITTNPIVTGFIPAFTAQTNQVKLKTAGTMSNVRIRVTDNATGIVLKYLPSKVVWDTQTGGFDFVIGDNTIDLIETDPGSPGIFNVGLSPFRLDTGQQINIRVEADNVDFLGDTLGNPFLSACIQEGTKTSVLIGPDPEVDSLSLLGATNGKVTLDAPAVVTDYNITFPSADGSTNEILKRDASGNLQWVVDAAGINIYDSDGTIDTTSAQRTVTITDASGNKGLLFESTDGGSGISSEVFFSNELIDFRVITGANSTGFDIDNIDGIRVFDGVKDIGLFYHADYSTQGIAVKGGRWIPDRSYVLNPWSDAGGDSSLLSWETKGTNGATIRWFVGDSDPDGFATGNPGDMYILALGNDSELFQHQGSGTDDTSWARFTHTNTPIVADTLAATLAVGNETGGNDVVLSVGDVITAVDDLNIKANSPVGVGSGGLLTIKSGNGGTTSGTAGSLILEAGSAQGAGDNSGGTCIISSGSSTGGNSAGTMEVAGGDGGTTGFGGDTRLNAGDGGSTSGPAGDVKLTAGDSTSGDAGIVELNAGTSSGADPGGTITLNAGAGGATSGAGGDIALLAGSATGASGDAGDITLTAGNSLDTNIGGDVDINAGDSTGGNGGRVLIDGGASTSGTSNGGLVQITGGTTTSIGGGDATGQVHIHTPNATSGLNTGDILLNPGDVDTGDAGAILIDGGNSTGSGDATNAIITGGDAHLGTGQAGSSFLVGGFRNATGGGGNATVEGGPGAASGADGGSAFVTGGPANGAGDPDGGNVVLAPGSGSGSGSTGLLQFEYPSTTYTWPEDDGTGSKVLTSDGAGLLAFENLFLSGFADWLGLDWISAASVNVSAGSWRDDTNVFNLTLGIATDAVITTVGAGGLQTGSSEASSTWYGVYVIGDTTGVNATNTLLIPDGTGFSESGYDVKRRVGWARNDAGSDLIAFTTDGNARRLEYQWQAGADDLAALAGGNATTFADVDLSSFMPTTSRMSLLLIGRVTTATAQFTLLRTNGTAAEGDLNFVRPMDIVASTERYVRDIATDASQIIEYEQGSAGGSTFIWVRGFIDNI